MNERIEFTSGTQEPWDFVEDARRAASLVELEAVTSRYAGVLGFAHYGFAIRFPDRAVRADDSYMYFHNIPEPWGRHRYEKTYTSSAADQDPLMLHLRAGLSATAFSSRGMVTHTRPDIVRRSKKTLQQAGDYGLKCGVLAPLSATPSGWSFMVMTTPDTSDVRDVIQALPNFLFFAHHVHCVARLASRNGPQPAVQLNGRELEILRWAAAGKTSWEIGRILNLAESTINFHLQAAARKLSVAGRLATCAQALTLGLIVL